MALLHLRYRSEPLHRESELYAVLPDPDPETADDRPLPVVYLLHGLSDGASTWVRRTAIERHAENLRMMVVMPEGGRSFYTDAVEPIGAWERHLLETVAWVDRTFRTVRAPSGRGIGGLSMGAFGSMKLGLKHPELFASVAAHSGFYDIRGAVEEPRWPDLPLIFGRRVADDEDCYALAARPGPKPRIHMDCGIDDFLIDQNRDFHRHLERCGVAHEYREHPGIHDWAYWDAHVREALEFHAAGFEAG